jgi:phosphatidylserine/phosphatidylglycerophosphate/cardiolipin synthase-like enzyme
MRNKSLKTFLGFILIFSLLSPGVGVTQRAKIIKDQEYFPLAEKAIKEATRSIKVIVFEMGYYPDYPLSPSNILIQNLIAAQRRGVEVKVILEVSDWNKRVTEKNKYAGKILSKNGVKVIYDSPKVTTHAKLIIVDSSLAILGSNNWTYYSLTQNKELSVLLSSPSLIGELEEYFDSLWEKSNNS